MFHETSNRQGVIRGDSILKLIQLTGHDYQSNSSVNIAWIGFDRIIPYNTLNNDRVTKVYTIRSTRDRSTGSANHLNNSTKLKLNIKIKWWSWTSTNAFLSELLILCSNFWLSYDGPLSSFILMIHNAACYSRLILLNAVERKRCKTRT